MKVLYIADPSVLGGATKSLLDVCSSMKEKGVDCTVCTGPQSDLNLKLDALGINNISCNYPTSMDNRSPVWWKRFPKKCMRTLDYYIRLPKSVHEIEKMLDVSQFDLIHTNSIRCDIGMELSRRYHIRNIVHLREFAQEDWDWDIYRRNYTGFANKNTDTFIAISVAAKDTWIKKGLDLRKFKVIYNGVDETQMKKQSDNHLMKDETLRLAIVGGICEAKGQHQIIEAIGFLNPDIKKNICLDVIGWTANEPYRAKLDELVAKYSLGNNVHFIGNRDDVYEILQNYHIGCMCSKSECFGRATAEYMHAHLGVIASNSAANPELIENEVSGLLYEEGNLQQLADCVTRFYTDRKLLLQCADNALLKAQKNFTKEINAEQIYSLYMGV